jgi:hypothetical protein
MPGGYRFTAFPYHPHAIEGPAAIGARERDLSPIRVEGVGKIASVTLHTSDVTPYHIGVAEQTFDRSEGFVAL